MVGHRTGAAQLQTFYPQGSQLCCAQGEASWQDLNRSVRNVSVQDLKVSALLTRSLYKISIKGLLVRSLYKISIRALLANAHGHFTRAILCGNLQEKCWSQIPGPVLCEPAQSKCTWTFHKSYFTRKFTAKLPDANLGATHCFVRACAVEMHLDISQKPFCVEFYRELARHGWYHLDWTSGLNSSISDWWYEVQRSPRESNLESPIPTCSRNVFIVVPHR